MKLRASKLIGSTAVLVALLAIFSYEAISQYREWSKRKEVQKEINTLSAQANDLAQKNTQLSDSLQFLNSPDFKDKIAREQLNLKKDGEIVVNFSAAQTNQQDAAAAAAANAQTSNVEKWYEYFFK